MSSCCKYKFFSNTKIDIWKYFSNYNPIIIALYSTKARIDSTKKTRKIIKQDNKRQISEDSIAILDSDYQKFDCILKCDYFCIEINIKYLYTKT